MTEEGGGAVGEVGRRGGMGGGEAGGGVAKSCLGVGGGNSFISIIMLSSKCNNSAFFYKMQMSVMSCRICTQSIVILYLSSLNLFHVNIVG